MMPQTQGLQLQGDASAHRTLSGFTCCQRPRLHVMSVAARRSLLLHTMGAIPHLADCDTSSPYLLQQSPALLLPQSHPHVMQLRHMQSHMLQPSPQPELDLKVSAAVLLVHPYSASVLLKPSSGRRRVLYTCTTCSVKVC